MNAHGLTTWIRLATSIGAVAFVACGDKGPPNIPQEEASETVADTVCEQADSCGCFSGGEDTLDSCTSQYESEVQQMIDAGEAAGLNYDGKCVGELLQAQQDLGCATEYEEDDFDCQPCKFFYGPKQLGEPCDEPGDDVFGDECAQGLYCSDTGCVDPCVLGDEGDDCSAGGCKDGLECHYSEDEGGEDLTAVCVRPVGEGEDCSAATCAEGLWCSYPSDNPAAAVCVRPADEGEDCVEVPCDEELDCDYETFTCVPRPPDPGTGDPCPNGYCADGSYCDDSEPDLADWVCVAQKDDGEPCDEHEECLNDECEAGVCVPEKAIACFH